MDVDVEREMVLGVGVKKAIKPNEKRLQIHVQRENSQKKTKTFSHDYVNA